MNGAPSDFLTIAAQPCWYCRWWGGPYAGLHSLCERPNGNRVTATPAQGCAFFHREPGVDDDGWAPVRLDRPPGAHSGPTATGR